MDDIILIDKVIGGYYSHEPLQKPPKPRSTPQNLGDILQHISCASIDFSRNSCILRPQ